MSTFTIISQYSFFIQFLITLLVTGFLYTKYHTDWFFFEKLFFGFFVLITVSNFIAIFFITTQGIPYAFVLILANLALVLLLMAGESLMGIKNFLLLYAVPLLVFLFDATLNILHAIPNSGLDPITYFIFTGIDILIFTIPSIIIYAYLGFKTKDISLAFFVLALISYLAGGFSLESSGELVMAFFYIFAVVCFGIATILPIIRNRLHTMVPEKSNAL